MRLEPIGNPIDEKAGEVLGLLSGWTADAVGGRNLALKSGGTHLSSAGNSYSPSIVDMDGRKALAFQDTNTIYLPTYVDVHIKVGDQIAFSFMAKASKPLSIGRVYIGPGSGNNNHLSGQVVTTEWERYSFTYTATTDSKVNLHMYPNLRNEDGTSETFYITEWKLEYGSKATPWTPAPEDSVQTLLDGGVPTSPLPLSDPNKPVQVHGVGFPDGKVAAPVGSIYTDTEATNGAIRWIKEKGTGNTGWTVEYGFTTRRRVTSGFYNDTEGMILDHGSIYISRTNDLVSFTLYNLKVTEPGSRSLGAQLPAGFEPSATLNFPGVISGNPGARMSVTLSGGVRIYGLSPNTWSDHFFSLVWHTSSSWPTTLPGVPA